MCSKSGKCSAELCIPYGKLKMIPVTDTMTDYVEYVCRLCRIWTNWITYLSQLLQTIIFLVDVSGESIVKLEGMSGETISIGCRFPPNLPILRHCAELRESFNVVVSWVGNFRQAKEENWHKHNVCHSGSAVIYAHIQLGKTCMLISERRSKETQLVPKFLAYLPSLTHYSHHLQGFSLELSILNSL